jgi:hypothetical protein
MMIVELITCNYLAELFDVGFASVPSSATHRYKQKIRVLLLLLATPLNQNEQFNRAEEILLS